MEKLRSFFSPSPSALNMKHYTLDEIIEKMKQSDEEGIRLPQTFANSLRDILQYHKDPA